MLRVFKEQPRDSLWRKKHPPHFTKENKLSGVLSCPRIPPGIHNNRTSSQVSHFGVQGDCSLPVLAGSC